MLSRSHPYFRQYCACLMVVVYFCATLPYIFSFYLFKKMKSSQDKESIKCFSIYQLTCQGLAAFDPSVHNFDT